MKGWEIKNMWNGCISTGSWTYSCAQISNQVTTLKHPHLHTIKRNGIIFSQINFLPGYTSSLFNMALLTDESLTQDKRLCLDPEPSNITNNNLLMHWIKGKLLLTLVWTIHYIGILCISHLILTAMQKMAAVLTFTASCLALFYFGHSYMW